jgi:hypothetical protein
MEYNMAQARVIILEAKAAAHEGQGGVKRGRENQ